MTDRLHNSGSDKRTSEHYGITRSTNRTSSYSKNDLKEENVELERYIAVTKDLFCIISFDGKIIKINRTWRDSFGYQDEQLVGKSIFEIIVKDDLYATKFAISESVKYEVVDKFFNRIQSHQGTTHYFEWRLKVFENRIYASGRDISDLILTQEKLEYYHNRDALTGMENSVENIILEAERMMYEDKLRKSREHKHSIIEDIQSNPRLLRKWDQIHAENVADHAGKIAEKMGLDPSLQELVKKAAFVHDIGKITVPSKILNKDSSLTQKELELIKRHPESGYQILRSVDEYASVAMIVLSHHEWVDGSGYPEKLKKEDIPLASRIISVADSFDAMTCGRTYTDCKTTEEAIQELRACSGSQFDPEVVSVFIEKVLLCGK